MYELFVTLLNMSLAAGVLIAAVILLRLLLRRVPKKYICILWALAALRLVLPVSVSSELSVYNHVGRVSDSSRIEYIHYTGHPEKPEAEIGFLVSDISSPDGPTAIFSTADFYLPPVMIIWVTGTGAMLAYAAISYLQIRRRTEASLQMTGNVYLCDRIPTPFILGIFRPRIFLPSILDGEQMRSVIAHEKAHLRRLDHIWKPLGFALLSIHWFNPLVWIGYGLLCRDIEMACDEAVIRNMSGAQKKAYSQTLLTCSMPRGFITACPLAFGEVSVKQRVKGIRSYRKPGFWVVLLAAIVCIAVAVVFLTNPAAEAESSLSGPTFVSFDAMNFTLPAGVGFEIDEDGRGILTDGETILGGVQIFPAEGGKKPEDLAWINRLPLPEWDAENLGWSAGGGGGRYSIEFFSDVPPETPRPLLTSHEFFYHDGLIYDLWFDELTAPASLWQNAPSTVRFDGEEEPAIAPAAGEEAAAQAIDSILTHLGDTGVYLSTNRISDPAQPGTQRIGDYYLVDSNAYCSILSTDASGKPREEVYLLLDGKLYTNAGQEYAEEFTLTPSSGAFPFPWLDSFDLKDLEYIDTLSSLDGVTHLYYCSKPFPGETEPGYWVDFHFNGDGLLDYVFCQVHKFEENAFNVTETIFGDDTDMLRARINAAAELVQ